MSLKSLATVFASLCSLAASSNMVAVRQDPSGKATIDSMKPLTAEVVLTSNVSFTFSWPLVQMTSDTSRQEFYITTYPADMPGAVLYKLDRKLNVMHSWSATPFSFFDLQYSVNQATLYGIYVSSTYGRVLTNYTADLTSNEIVGQQLFELPYMWYVNASSFHQRTSTYFALINNFPGKSNSTNEQQLIVADFSKDISVAQPVVNVFKILNPTAILQFIAFSEKKDRLFYAGIKLYGSVIEVGTLDIKTGQVDRIIWTATALAAGPLVANEVETMLQVFVKSATKADTWELWAIPYNSMGAARVTTEGQYDPYVIRSFTGKEYAYFAAAAESSTMW